MRYTRFGVTEYNRDAATPGLTLFSPLLQKATYLIDMEGKVLHRWNLDHYPGNYAYLMPNGNLLAAIRTDEGPEGLAAKGGKIQEIDWDGTVVWEYIDHFQHHDFRRAPNGNTVYLGWTILPDDAAARVKGGREGSERDEGIYGDYVREVNPAGETVWEWMAHEHMEIENYPICPICPRVEWAHPNALQPLENGDVLVSWRHNHLIAHIDRKTGKFKWEMCDAKLGHQHDFQMLDNGNYMVYANGSHAIGGPANSSAVLEIDAKTSETVWEYRANPAFTFNSPFISGAQRLWSGNTLICEGSSGRVFEVTRTREVVWEWISPFVNTFGSAHQASYIFRPHRYAPDHPAIADKDLDPDRHKSFNQLHDLM